MDIRTIAKVSMGMASDDMPKRDRFNFFWWYTDVINLRVIAEACCISHEQCAEWFTEIVDDYKRRCGDRHGFEIFVHKLECMALTKADLPDWATSGECGFIARHTTDADKKMMREAIKGFAADRKKRAH